MKPGIQLLIRYWKYGGGFIYNLEAAYQFGTFGAGKINAWTTAIDIGYVFEKARFKPTVNLRNDYISGDRIKGGWEPANVQSIVSKRRVFWFQSAYRTG